MKFSKLKGSAIALAVVLSGCSEEVINELKSTSEQEVPEVSITKTSRVKRSNYSFRYFESSPDHGQGDGLFLPTAKWLSGDFDGNGKGDIVRVFGDNDKASMAVNMGYQSGIAVSKFWAVRDGGFWVTQRWLSGDFNGNGKDDVVRVFNHNDKATAGINLSTGSSFTPEQHWMNQDGGFWETQRWLSGDFNGDGKDDLVRVFNHNGKATAGVNLSTGGSFAREQQWMNQNGGFWDSQKWLVGDINGDGKDDLIRVFGHGSKATAGVNLSTGSGFASEQHWMNQDGGFYDSQEWIAADYNKDGLTDLARIFEHDGKVSITVNMSDGNRFEKEQWCVWREGDFHAEQRWIVGNFDIDESKDLTVVYRGNRGNMFTATYASQILK